MSNQQNTVMAQGRSDPNENTDIILHGCRVTAASDMRPVQGPFKTFLGRPWREYSRTLVMKSILDGLIHPAVWMPWSGNFSLKTPYYGEYMNTGSGAATGGRVKWPGFHGITNPLEAGKFKVGNFLAGQSWIAGTGVAFDEEDEGGGGYMKGRKEEKGEREDSADDCMKKDKKDGKLIMSRSRMINDFVGCQGCVV